MANRELARLVGHVFGDGSIHKNKKYFIYTNSTPELQEAVQKIVERQFGEVKFNEGTSISGTPRLQYSNKVGKELAKWGAPVGSKTLQETEIPLWIRNGTEEIKSSFLGALFDDEGSFRNDASKQIVFKSAKEISLKPNLLIYLNQLITLLKDLGINTSEIKGDQIKKRKDGKQIISLRFWITSKENFSKFQNKIFLFHPQKIKNLSEMVPAG